MIIFFYQNEYDQEQKNSLTVNKKKLGVGCTLKLNRLSTKICDIFSIIMLVTLLCVLYANVTLATFALLSGCMKIYNKLNKRPSTRPP